MKTLTTRSARRVLGALLMALLFVTVLIVPGVASAQAPIATAVLYEVAEALKLKGPKTATSPEDFKRRIAEATLLGKDVTGAPGTAFYGSGFIVAEAVSRVNVVTGIGPIRGTFDLLTDTDPTRQSLDTLAITRSGVLEGQLDLSTARQGYAQVRGRYRFQGRGGQEGQFQGVFLIPFQLPIPGLETQYWYLDLGPLAGTCAGATTLPIGPGGAAVSLCPLTSAEYSLGIPLTKAVLVMYD